MRDRLSRTGHRPPDGTARTRSCPQAARRRIRPPRVRPAVAAVLASTLLASTALSTAGCRDGDTGGAAPRTEESVVLAAARVPAFAAGRSAAHLAADRRFTLVTVGDVLVHAPLMREARATAGGDGYDFGPMLARVRRLISSADLAICNQETPVSPTNTRLTVPRTLSFNAPHEIATALRRAGFDACSTASNHTWDRGLGGVRATLDALDDAKLAHSGSARGARSAAKPPIYQVNGVRVGHLAYSYSIVNTAGPSTTVPEQAPWLREMLWPALGAKGVLAQARRLRERGAEFVVVSIHWGSEYQQRPDARQRRLARALLSSPDVDLVVGHHPHVVQPCQQINGKYVAYSLGNFLSNQSPTQSRDLPVATQDGVVLRFTVEEVSRGRFRVTRLEAAPTWVTIPGHVVRRATTRQFADSRARTLRTLRSLGPGTCDVVPLP